MQSLGAMIERCATSFRDDPAIVDGERVISFDEMLAQVRGTGRALLDLGLRRGDRVAVLMGNRPELLDVFWGALWAGLAIVPLNHRLGAADHEFILGDSGARALCYDAEHADRVAAVGGGVEHLLSADEEAVLEGGHDLGRLLERQRSSAASPRVSAADLAILYYTGGTTGRPKGVAHSHETMLFAFLSELIEMGLGERERFAHVAPLTHASGAFALPVWLRGGCNVLFDRFDPELLLAHGRAQRVTATLMVPTMIYVLLDQLGSRAREIGLRTIVYGAAPMGRERLLQALDVFGPVLTQLYGQTEAPNQICVLSKADHAEALSHEALGQGAHDPLTSCGRPVAIAQTRIADEEDREVGQDEPGEILVRGPHVMLRYWQRPEETAEALRGGWLHTGDVARSDERGFLHIVDRKKDMIVSGGFNVFPREVEQTLFEHPSVRDVAVIGIPDQKWGEAVKAVVALHPSRPAEPAELIEWVKQRKGSLLAPKSIDVVDALPLTAVGKHDKPALRAGYWHGAERAVN